MCISCRVLTHYLCLGSFLSPKQHTTGRTWNIISQAPFGPVIFQGAISTCQLYYIFLIIYVNCHLFWELLQCVAICWLNRVRSSRVHLLFFFHTSRYIAWKTYGCRSVHEWNLQVIFHFPALLSLVGIAHLRETHPYTHTVVLSWIWECMLLSLCEWKDICRLDSEHACSVS